MIAVKPTQMRDNFKTLCDQVVNGETVIVSRPNNENVVVLSEKEYNAMQKAARNGVYLAMIDKSMAELEKGGFVVKTLDELRTLEQ
ncbi:MAG: antitoxin PHD [Clostridiales bacterium GWC2_40_7]|nr:MAG: antitoxin PHD [Clostridiales bacterium GWC2_40_7]